VFAVVLVVVDAIAKAILLMVHLLPLGIGEFAAVGLAIVANLTIQIRLSALDRFRFARRSVVRIERRWRCGPVGSPYGREPFARTRRLRV